MRWEALFADLEGRLAAAGSAAALADVPELTRAEHASVDLAGRLRAADRATLLLRDGRRLSGLLVEVAGEWLLLDVAGRQVLVPLSALVAVADLGERVTPATGVGRRLGLGHALRALARDRAVVQVATTAAVLVGRLGRVGADHLDVVVADAATPRLWTVRSAEVVSVTST